MLTEEEVRDLIRACSTRAPSGLRNRALLIVLWRGMLRVAEALALRTKDLDREAGTVRVLHGKADQDRTVGLDPESFAIIERWLDRRAELGIRGRSPVFCSVTAGKVWSGNAGELVETRPGAPLRTSYVRGLLERLGKKAGIQKRVHPHGLRHTGAAELAREGVPLNVIQAQLGHSSLATTDRYLAHIAPAQLIETMRARSWSPKG